MKMLMARIKSLFILFKCCLTSVASNPLLIIFWSDSAEDNVSKHTCLTATSGMLFMQKAIFFSIHGHFYLLLF